jgi:hypothetical protein
LAQDELARSLVVDRHAHDIARQQITRELHAPELSAHRTRQSTGECGLANTRHVLDQDVSPRDERHQG